MDKINAFLSNANSILISIGCSVVVLACLYRAFPGLMSGEAKVVIKVVVGFVVAFVVYVFIPTIFSSIKGALG